MRKRTIAVTLVSAAVLLTVAGCKKEPACKAGKLSPEWEKAPLSSLVPSGERTICEVPASEAATHAEFWVDKTVHDANMASVDQAQSAHWDRIDDNWYRSLDHSDAPKWSEFASGNGKLRIDIKQAGGGALIDVKYTPKGN